MPTLRVCRQYPGSRVDSLPNQRNVDSCQIEHAPGTGKIILHVDHKNCSLGDVDCDRIWLGIQLDKRVIEFT